MTRSFELEPSSELRNGDLHRSISARSVNRATKSLRIGITHPGIQPVEKRDHCAPNFSGTADRREGIQRIEKVSTGGKRKENREWEKISEEENGAKT